MMEMIVTLYVPRTAPLAAALEEKAARAVRGGLPGAPCAVCGEQSRGQKDVHVKAQTGRAGRPAGDESARGVWDCADEGGRRHAEQRAYRGAGGNPDAGRMR